MAMIHFFHLSSESGVVFFPQSDLVTVPTQHVHPAFVSGLLAPVCKFRTLSLCPPGVPEETDKTAWIQEGRGD